MDGNTFPNNKVFLATNGGGIARAALDGAGAWQVATKLAGQPIRCLAAAPANAAVVYAGADDGVWRSADRGLTWQRAGLDGHNVKSLAVSPHEPGVVYAGTRPPCIFVTRDAGATWVELESFRTIRFRWLWRSPAEPPDFRAYVQGLSVSPTDPNLIVAGIEFGAVIRSTDGGQTWSNHIPGTVRDCHSLTFHAHRGDWVYEAGGGGMAVSRDGGARWERPREGLPYRYGWACAADPERPEVWYVSAGPMGWSGAPQVHKDGAAGAYIYRRSGGSPWQQLAGGLPQPLDYMAYGLLTDPQAPGHLYAGLSSGDVWHSADYGDAWQKLPFSLGSIHRDLLIL